MSTGCSDVLSDYFTHARIDILDFLPEQFGMVIDVGGSSGATLSAIKAKWPSTRTVCIDRHEASIETARRRGHEAFVCDLENEIPDVFGTGEVVLFLDVLEHLTEPWQLLTRITSRLPSGAVVIVSLPNVRFWEASFRLFVLGKWTLKDAGILDRTHLRFFTRQSGAELLRGAGLAIRKVRSQLPVARRYRLINFVSLGLFRDFLTAQYLFAAEKPAASLLWDDQVQEL
jgi:2-polyprenyl-3-methyl-5-hydroxy-6-metoxy-1,4-benzoquinol methylase